MVAHPLHRECPYNMELNDLRKIIRMRNFEVSVEKKSVCKVLDNLAEHGTLSVFYTNDVIYYYPSTLDVILM